MLKRPFTLVTARYTVPEGWWVAVTEAPITSSPCDVTLPLIPEVVICAIMDVVMAHIITAKRLNRLNIIFL